MTLLAQAIALDAPVGPLALGVVIVAAVGALAYFIRTSFEDFKRTLAEVVEKVNARDVVLAKYELRIEHLEERVRKLETRCESEGCVRD